MRRLRRQVRRAARGDRVGPLDVGQVAGGVQTSSRRAPGIASAIAWPCMVGGVAGSSAPAITSVGALIAPSAGAQVDVARSPRSSRRSPRPAWRAASRRSRSTARGRRSRNAGVNQRSSDARRRSPACPRADACARARASLARRPSSAEVQQSTSRSMRSGASIASHIAIMPPSESPHERDALEPEAVEQREQRRRRGRRSSTGRRAPARRRGRAGRSGARGSARRAPAACVPHLERGAERVEQHERRRVGGPSRPWCTSTAHPMLLPVPVERAVDERVRGAEVAGRVQQRGPRPLEVGGDRVRRPAARRGTAPGSARGAPRLPPASCAASRPRRSASASAHALGQQQPAGGVEVRAHPLGVRPRRPSSDSRSAAAAPPVKPSAARSGRHSACHAPAARSCSWAIAAEQDRDAAADACCAQRQRAHRGRPGCACAASPTSRRGPAGLGDLADLGLRQQHRRRARSCRASRRRRASARGQLGRPRRARVPGQHRLGEAELRGQLGEHPRPVLAERGERAGRAAELRRRGAPPASRSARVEQRRQPAGGLEPERRRQRLLQQRAAGHQRVAVLVREPRARVRAAPSSSREDQRQRAARHEHRGGVEHVLAGRAAVDVAGGVALSGRGQRRDQRRHRVAARRGLAPSSAGSKRAGVAAPRRSPPPRRPGSAPPAPRRPRAPPRRRSIARSQARRTPPSRSAAGSEQLGAEEARSDVKEDGLAVALQADVEAQHAAILARDQRRAPPRARSADSTGSAALASASSGK